MIQNVEEFRPELYLATFSQEPSLGVFHHRVIEVGQPATSQVVPRFGSSKSLRLDGKPTGVIPQGPGSDLCAGRDCTATGNDYITAVRIWKKYAEQGNVSAEYLLGYAYASGEGVRYDNAEADKWWLKAAEQGSAEAQYNLGLAYAMGDGVTQDYADAVKWYRQSAEQGEPKAQYNLGVSYANGQGVTQDLWEAYMGLSLADSSFPDQAKGAAENGMAQIARNLSAGQIAQAEAMASKCCAQHHKNCQ